MANKLFLVCSTLAFCVLLTNASIYRTIIEFDENDATNQRSPFRQQQKCEKELQQEQQLRACQEWISKRIQGSTINPFDDEDDEGLLQQCCNELGEEDQDCVCPTLKEAANSIRLQRQHGSIQLLRIYTLAKNLPNFCKMQQVGTCPFSAILPPY